MKKLSAILRGQRPSTEEIPTLPPPPLPRGEAFRRWTLADDHLLPLAVVRDGKRQQLGELKVFRYVGEQLVGQQQQILLLLDGDPTGYRYVVYPQEVFVIEEPEVLEEVVFI